MSYTAEYTWTEVEPAFAILCACVVTLRPLFANINLNLSKLSSLFSRSSSQRSNSKDSEMLWPASQHKNGQIYLRLNEEAKNTVHVVDAALQDEDPDFLSPRRAIEGSVSRTRPNFLHSNNLSSESHNASKL